MSKDCVYRLANLEKTYNGRTVVSIEELEVHRGEILSFVGPSGSGKSTLLRLLNFLEYPSSGWLEFDGQRFETKSDISLESRRRVTTVFQRPLLLNRSVYDNVTYGLRLRGVTETNEKAREVLAMVGLEHLSRQRARLLSGGEAQRVALARAIVLRPEVLLLDEPTANLDPYNVGLIETIVHQTNQEHGTTVVLVTHNVFQAKRLAQRVAFVLNGRLVEVSEVDQFFNAPQDERTRAFVKGEMVY